MTISVNVSSASYDIILETGALSNVANLFNLNRKVCIVTDDGVPKNYAAEVANAAKQAYIFTFKSGEMSKSLETYQELCKFLLLNHFSRYDCIVAVGGGVVGDLAGFAASTYMRGIDFYNVPTTLLSQLDSSIGGKVAVNFGGIKNILGAFYHPKKVLIDPSVLNTLPKRQFASGMAEAIKVGMTSDRALFELIETEPIEQSLLEIIRRALCVKKDIVEQDEKETGLRRILNFGHTIGHGIECVSGLYHGECVALGMIPMSSDSVKERLIAVLEKVGLPTSVTAESNLVCQAITHDKKAQGTGIRAVNVNEIGTYNVADISFKEISEKVSQIVTGGECK